MICELKMCPHCRRREFIVVIHQYTTQNFMWCNICKKTFAIKRIIENEPGENENHLRDGKLSFGEFGNGTGIDSRRS